MAEEIDFDADLIEVPLRYRGKSYVLREAPGEAVAAYRAKARELLDGGADRIDPARLFETESLLVASCLFERSAQGERPVGADAARLFPHRMFQRLYSDALRINGLDQRAAEKNGQGPAEGPSGTSSA